MRLKHWLLILGCLGLLLGAVTLAGVNPWEAVTTLLKGTLGSPSAISGTLRETTPLLIAGVAVFLALQAGLFNIGVEGQLVIGAISCAYVALHFGGVLGVVLGILAALVAGALWALPAGLIRAYRGGHEVITTIMMNNVAGFLTTALVAGVMRDPHQQSLTTAQLDEHTRLPWLYATDTLQISSGVLFGIVILIGFGYWLRRFVAGYELRAVGLNPVAAKLAGVQTPRVIVRSMLISGAIAGLAGAVQVLGYEGRFYADFSPGYGFNALGVALLAGSNPLGILPAALFFAVLSKGSSSLQIMGVPKGISFIVLAVLIVIFAAVRYRRASTVTAS